MDDKASSGTVAAAIPQVTQQRNDTWLVPPVVIPAALAIGFVALLFG